MKKQELYLAIYQAVSHESCITDISGVLDFQRNLSVHIARNSNGQISHLTLEFTGPRARYLCSILFDGSGDGGAGMNNFAMPKVQLQRRQKAVMFLACVEFLIDAGLLDANIEYFRDRVSSEFDSAHSLLPVYDEVLKNARCYCEHNWDKSTDHLSIAKSVGVITQNFTF